MVPRELRYTREHEWVRASGDEATIGITEFAAHELGDVVQALGRQQDLGLQGLDEFLLKPAEGLVVPVPAGAGDPGPQLLEAVHEVRLGDEGVHGEERKAKSEKRK